MLLSPNLPRGMRDFDGADSAGIERIRERFVRACGLYGYGLVDPSPLENLSTLETRSGPAIRDEIYHFEDKGGRRVALRFDFTMGLARRAAQQRSERLPSKVASFGGVFRYDEPQQGRYRYFHQWDMEVFGSPSADADAEIIEATSLLFESLGMKKGVSIRVCHRGLVESLVRSVFGRETPAGEMSEILRAMDKAAKKPRDVIISEYADAAGGDGRPDRAAMLGELLEYASMRGSADEIAGRRGEISSLDGWDDLASLSDSLGSRGVDCAVIDLGIVRGLDYYSGMVFEVFDDSDDDGGGGDGGDGRPSQYGSLAGGGRYDALMKAFDRPDLGAAGVAGGVERTMLAMRRRGLLDGDRDGGSARAGPAAAADLVAVVCATPDARGVAAGVASALRRGGIATEFDIAGRPLRKQMASASRAGAHTAIIIGTEEVQSGQALLRMMDTGEQRAVRLEELTGDPASVIARVSQERPL